MKLESNIKAPSSNPFRDLLAAAVIQAFKDLKYIEYRDESYQFLWNDMHEADSIFAHLNLNKCAVRKWVTGGITESQLHIDRKKNNSKKEDHSP